MKIVEKGDGLNKAQVWIDEKGNLKSSCYICDPKNKTTERCKKHSIKGENDGSKRFGKDKA